MLFREIQFGGVVFKVEYIVTDSLKMLITVSYCLKLVVKTIRGDSVCLQH